MEAKTYRYFPVAFWLAVGVVLAAAYVSLPNPSGKIENIIIRACFAVFDTISSFLLSLFILKKVIPYYSENKSVVKSILLFLLSVVFFITIRFSVSYYFMQRHFNDRIWADDFLWGRIIINNLIYDNLMLMVLLPSSYSGIRFIAGWYGSQAKIQKLENEKIKSELDFLKAQVNPHFLFNTLNAVYFSIDEQNKKGREILFNFSEMLRYQLYECAGSDVVPLTKELAYIQQYIDIERIRRDNRYFISFKNEVLSSFEIAPLLLLPFVENSFKHVSNYIVEENKIEISAWQEDESFCFRVTNTYSDGRTIEKDNAGIGLRNVKRRLELLYRGNYSLKTHQSTGVYDTLLRINLT
jgi:hypothetical protein